ncbi:hypothetical protein ACFQHV_15780 [Promicromonospora thailandica]|uniref:hypothetical protein n=1 Tax=Promicromonospora thailandica TaxID=765201 RepID=UPI0020A46BE1|nr:hypothetical protein [Promicromonospora thailandica]BFF20296.1 hypothetical protein GCM10025730_38170 [Promicromonospora thailandica]
MLPVTLSTFEATSSSKHLPKLTPSKLKAIEESCVLAVNEKVQILLLFLYKKWIAEVAIGLERKDESTRLLDQLGLPWYIESYQGPYVERWVQVGANQAVLDYVHARRGELSDLESGILYGFPPTHVLGYVGIISKKPTAPNSVALYMLAGTYSKNFQDAEVKYFNEIWWEVEKVSPVIAGQAQQEYESLYRQTSE